MTVIKNETNLEEKVKGMTCPRCKANTALCEYISSVEDIEGADYWDVYKASCSTCGYEEIKEFSEDSFPSNKRTASYQFSGFWHCDA
jgi:RNase P subunit RPR2